MSMRALSILCAAVFLLSACSGDPRPLQEAVEVQELGLSRLVIETPQTAVDTIVINPGQALQFSFTAFDANNVEIPVANEDRRWELNNHAVASVSASGLLTGRADGEVELTVRIGGIVAAPVSVQVSSATLASLDGITGQTELTECSVSEPYIAIGTFTDGSARQLDNLEWRVAQSDSGRLISSSATEAVVGALLPGSLTLTASSGGISGSTLINVADGVESVVITPSPIVVERSANQSLVARANYSIESVASQNVTALADWSVEEDTIVASVTNTGTNRGVIRGLVVGRTQVSVECSDFTASAEVEVIEPQNIVNLRIEPTDDPIELFLNGSDLQLSVFAVSSGGSDEDVTELASWRVTSGEDIISVDNTSSSGGLVTALAVGRATIEVTFAGTEASVGVIVQ